VRVVVAAARRGTSTWNLFAKLKKIPTTQSDSLFFSFAVKRSKTMTTAEEVSASVLK